MSDANRSGKDSDSGYVVVARRYRPRDFDQLVGQDHVAQALRGAIETSRVGHAYLFTGARGVGKTSTARIFAKALNDPGGPTAHPDSGNDIAQAIDAGEDVDVIEIDGASNRGIEEIRSLRANVNVRPSRSRFKIYIIDEVHMLTGPAFNALLKTLEEPPEHVKFIFCTTDPEKIPITVLSRCQRFDFAPVESDKIVGRLREIIVAENGTADDEALELLARRAAGSMRDSQSLLEQVLSFSDGHLTAEQVHSMLGTADDQRLHALAIAMADRDAAAALVQVDQAIAAGIDAGRLADQMLGYFRDLMATSVGCDASLLRYAASSMHTSLRELGDRWGLQTVLAIVGLLDETLVRVRLSVHSRVLIEATIIQICHLPDLQQLADLTAALGAPSGQPGAASAEKKKPPLSRAAANPAPLTSPATLAPSDPNPPTPDRAENRADDRAENRASRGDDVATRGANRLDLAHAGPPGSHRVADRVIVATTTTAVTTTVDGPVLVHSPAVGDSEQPIDDATLQRCMAQVLDEVDPIAGTLIKAAKRISVTQPGQVRIRFAGNAGLAMSRCDKPETKDEIQRTIRRVTGRRVGLVIEMDAAELPPPPAAKNNGRNRMQRMKEIEAIPLIQSCVELLGAEIVKIDSPRK